MSFAVTLAIARKEFLENVLSWKFLLALALAVLLVGTSVLVLGSAFRDDHAAYQATLDEYARQDNAFADVAYQVFREVGRPNLLAIFVGGAGDDLRRTGGAAAVPSLGSDAGGLESGSASPLTRRFDPLDLLFVAGVVMTFMAVLYAYDAVSGERERGTLKLVLSNPVPKDAVLFGKYLGGMASLLVPFLVATLVGLALLPALDLRLSGDQLARLGVILLLFVLVASAFYLIGLVVSSLARRSSTSLVALTLVWLVLVFGAGNVAALVAENAVPTDSTAEARERMRAYDEEAFNEVQPLWEERNRIESKRWSGQNLTAAEEARIQEIDAQQKAAYDRAREQREAYRASVRRQLDDQVTFAERLASVSPAEAYRNLATALAGSDYWTFRDRLAEVEAYQAEVAEAREAWQEEHGQSGPYVVRTLGPVGAGARVEFAGDGFEPPAFEARTSTVGESLGQPHARRDLLVLVGANLLAFLGAYVALLRYDVR